MAGFEDMKLMTKPVVPGTGKKGKKSAVQKFTELKAGISAAAEDMPQEAEAVLQEAKEVAQEPLPGAGVRFEQAVDQTYEHDALYSFGAAAAESIPALAWRGLMDKHQANSDPNFKYRDYMTEYENKVSPEYHDHLRESVSKEDLDYRLSQAQEHMRNEQGQAASPFGAFAGTLVSDPLTFLAVPEAKLAGALAKTFGKGRAAVVGAEIGAPTFTSLLSEATRQELQGKVDPEGYVYSGAFTAGLVGLGLGAGALLRRGARSVGDDDITSLDDAAAGHGRALAEAAAESGDVQVTALKPEDFQQSPKPKFRFNNESGSWEQVQDFGDATAGAAAVPTPQQAETQFVTTSNQDIWREQFGSFADRIADDKESQTKWQKYIDKTSQAFGITAESLRFWKSNSRTLRGLGAALFENPLFGGRYVNQTAAVVQDLRKRQFQTGMLDINDQYAVWAKNEGIGRASADELLNTARIRFDSELRQELEYRWKGRMLDDQQYQQHLAGSRAKPEIRRAADSWDKANQKVLDDARASGVRGFDADGTDLPEFSRGYVHRQVDGQKLRAMFHKDQALFKRYKAALTKRIYADLQLFALRDFKTGKTIEVEKAKRLAKAYADSTFEVAMKKGFDSTGLFGTLTTDMRAELRLTLEKAGADKDAIDSLFRSFDEQAKDAGRTKYAKHRMAIDLYKDTDGLSLIDIYDNDLSRLAGSYGEEMSGRLALAKYGVTSDADIQDLRSVMMAEGATPEELSAFDDSLKMLMGKRIDGQGNRNVRRLKEFTRLTTLNATGWFAQTAETANATAQLGLSSTLKAIPALKATYNKIKNGTAEKTLLTELTKYMGPIGEDHLLMFPNIRLTDVNAADPVVLQQLDAVLAKGLHFQQYLNGMQLIHGGQRRLVVEGMAQRLSDAATGLGKISEDRLREVGLSVDQLNLLGEHLKVHGQYEKGRWVDLGLDKMDPYQRDELVTALHRSASQMIQSNFVGEQGIWMSRDLGSILTQLRTFPLVALQKQLLRGLYHVDTTSFSALAGGVTFGALVYMAQQQVGAAFLEDREGLLEERLAPSAVVKGAVQRMSMSSLLPEVFTVGAAFGVLPPEASFGNIGRTGEWRSQQLGASDVIPAFGPVEKAANTAGALSSAAGLWGADKQLNASDYRNMFGVLPYGNNPLAIWLSNALGLRDEE